MSVRTRACNEGTRAGRWRKARQFDDAFRLVLDYAGTEGELDVADAAITLAVHAGIAAADVICCRRLGEHAIGEDHNQAVALLRRADSEVANDLATLLGMKTRTGYSDQPATADMLKRADRALARLMEAGGKAHAG